MNLNNNKILITGGSTGIGFGLAQRFTEEKNTVIICGRRADALNEAKAKLPGLITRVCDVSKEEDRLDLLDWIKMEHGDLNVLVNNAGIQNWMNIDDSSFYDKAKNEIAINIEAPVRLVHLFQSLPSLDTIMNVTSGLSFIPLTKTPVYSATKAFFHSFTLSLRHLLQPRIEVIEIIPPALNTDLGGKGLHDAAPPVSEFIDAIFRQLKEGKKELTFGFSEQAASIGKDQLSNIFNRLNPS